MADRWGLGLDYWGRTTGNPVMAVNWKLIRSTVSVRKAHPIMNIGKQKLEPTIQPLMEEPKDLPRIVPGGLILSAPVPIHPNPVKPLPLYTEQVPESILVHLMKGGPIQPLNHFSQTRPSQIYSNRAIVPPVCPRAPPKTQSFVPQQPSQIKYAAIPPPLTYESPVPKIIESVECPKQDSSDDEEFLAGELSELSYPTPIKPESIIQNLQSTKFESPLLLPIQDQVISMPTLMISGDPHLDSSDSKSDQDLDQSIEYVLESEPLDAGPIFTGPPDGLKGSCEQPFKGA
ncbi:hypothetical protein QJS10_CPA03g01319 [Acorus calamus]|uniref:Uncharacterized protein n=1 Tax=Acorus calamus TaxID=4465 RepID=A0AAV9F962_ACOCL|nr:hypothetical protein QJS10_CPA03g01319 [Acorus calamus]